MSDARQPLPRSIPRGSTRPQSLSRRLVALLAWMLLVTLMVIGASVFLFISRNEQLIWQGRQREAARYASQSVEAFLQRARDSLALASRVDRSVLAAEPQAMRHFLEQNAALLEIIRLDAHGEVIAISYQDAPVLANQFTISQSNWFLGARAGRLYLGDIRISGDNEPYLIMAISAPDGGVVAARLRMNTLWEVVAGIKFGQKGQAYVINAKGTIVAHTQPGVALARTSLVERPEMAALSQAPNHEWSGAYMNFEGTPVIGVTVPLAGTEWVVISEIPQSEAFAVSRTALLLLGSGMALLGALMVWVTSRFFLARLIIQPIERLRAGAEQIGQGDLGYRIDIIREDEVGQLAATLNRMASQLQEMYQQIAAHSHDLERHSSYLEAAAEVGRAATSILDTGQLIWQVVELVRERFGLYYVGLFLLDESEEWAILQAGTGEAGKAMLARGHRIKVGEGMIGWSIAHAQARVALEAGQDTVRLTTPELPETRSEAALPLRSRGRVLGALTVQHSQPAAFDHDTLAVLQTMADQVAVALDNAQLFAETQKAVEAERRAYGEMSRQAWSDMLRARPTLGYLCGPKGTIQVASEHWLPEMVRASETGQAIHDGGPTLALPIKIRDHVQGVVRLRKPDDAGGWAAEEIATMETLTEQLSIALDGARLFEDVQRRAARERVVGEITTRIRETLDMDVVLQTAIREMGEALGMAEVEVRMMSGLAAQSPAAASRPNGHDHPGSKDDGASLSKGVLQ